MDLPWLIAMGALAASYLVLAVVLILGIEKPPERR
jgi:hypothetical protein